MPLLPLLFVVFLVLKLTGFIDWSWWLVTAPLTIPAAIAAFLYALAGAASLLGYLLLKKKGSK